MHYPLILTVWVEGAINLVRLAYLLFAFKREAPIALTLHRAIMQLRTQPCPSLCTNDFSPRIPFAQNIPKGTSALSVYQTGCPNNDWGKYRACNLQLVFMGKKEESGLLVKMSSQTSGGSFLLGH